jgi:hypothetical protein
MEMEKSAVESGVLRCGFIAARDKAVPKTPPGALWNSLKYTETIC